MSIEHCNECNCVLWTEESKEMGICFACQFFIDMGYEVMSVDELEERIIEENKP